MGVSTNIIAKISKNATESMESLAKIMTTMQRRLDNIVEINSTDNEVYIWLFITNHTTTML